MTHKLSSKFKNGLVDFIKNKYGEIFDVDSYKISHSAVYRDDASWMMSYFESRGGEFIATQFSGMQILLLEHFSRVLTHSQVDKFKAFAESHGEPFPEKMFRRIVDVYKGKYPIIIKSVDEGTIVPTGNVLMTIETSVDDPQIMSIVSYFETKLMSLWYPTTVATLSYEIKKVCMKALAQTTNNPWDFIDFAVNDFGSRGTTDLNASIFAGVGHLQNFMGSDNIPSVLASMEAYNIDDVEDMPVTGFSVVATEHSIMSSEGRDGEEKVFKSLIDIYGDNRDIIACVADTFDIDNFCNKILLDNKEQILSMKARLVVRPDSGEPVEMVCRVLSMLENVFGVYYNDKGFKVLHDKVRVIQSDGVNLESISEIYKTIINLGWSAENIIFGIGGALVQKVNRDTQKFAIKCSSMYFNGKYNDVFKAPKTASFKKSKAGRLALLKVDGKLITTTYEEWAKTYQNVSKQELTIRYMDGELHNMTNFADVRERANSELKELYKY